MIKELIMCCIIATMSSNIITDYMQLGSAEYTHYQYLNGTMEKREIPRYKQMQSCEEVTFDFKGDYVNYYVPVGSNMEYEEAMNTPLNLSMVFEERTHYREPYIEDWVPKYKGYVTEDYCDLMELSLQRQLKEGKK